MVENRNLDIKSLVRNIMGHNKFQRTTRRGNDENWAVTMIIMNTKVQKIGGSIQGGFQATKNKDRSGTGEGTEAGPLEGVRRLKKTALGSSGEQKRFEVGI